MDPTSAVRATIGLISLIEFCWALVAETPGLLKHIPIQSSEEVIAQGHCANNRVVAHLRALSAPIDKEAVGSTGHGRELVILAQRCLAEADILRASLEETVFPASETQGEAFETIQDRLHKTVEIAFLRQRLSQHGQDIGTWLIEAISDEKWDFNAQLKNILKETELGSSVRSSEIMALRRVIRSALGHPSKEVSIKKQAHRESSTASLASSDSSEAETRQKKRLRQKRHFRRGANSKASAPASANSGVPSWFPQVKRCLTTLSNLVEVVPIEMRVLNSLSYDSIDCREDSIQEAESGTFRWMLDDPIDPELPKHMITARQQFISWLNSGSGVFHISGNAGSGKSTLMKFLRHHNRTRLELEQWAGEKKLIFSCFYFWNSGDTMQMSLEGLYRSILLEVSRQCPDLIPVLFPTQWQTLSMSPGDRTVDDSMFGPEAITDAFTRLLAQDVHPTHGMCFFIDGLDEYSAENVDYRALSRHLLEWSERSGVKLCVSARPYQEFLEIFSPDLRLHLHDLTARDIETYATNSFHSNARFNQMDEITNHLVDIIVQKSEGVFLWAHVVVRSLASMASRGASPEELVSNLEAYPTDIDGLYDRLLDSLAPEEHLRSNQMLLLAAENPFAQPLNALWFVWADELESPDFPSGRRPYTAAEVKTAHETVRDRVDWLTKGLLKMHTDRRERKNGDQFYRQRVQFFHRTARDYLRSPARRDALLRSVDVSKLTETYARFRLAEIVLAGKYHVALGADPRRRRLYSNYVRSLFNMSDESGNRYQVPRRYMHILRDDLATTTSEQFHGAYAVSGYWSISNHNVIDEDPESPASFLNFALSYGQYEYAFEELQDTQPSAKPCDGQLSLLLTAAFSRRKNPLERFAASFPQVVLSPLDNIRLRLSPRDDPLAATSLHSSILMVFVSTLVFGCLGEYRVRQQYNARSTALKNVKDLFTVLGHILESLDSNSERRDFICILRKPAQAHQDNASDGRFFFTTLGQLALRFTPPDTQSLFFRPSGQDNTMDLDATSVDRHVLPERLPSWTAHRLRDRAPANDAILVKHDALDEYFCDQVVSNTESLLAEDNLFFRIY